ncbi:hypothetical protein Ciccas_002967 [Cichlidogyrus casuarinus]|uniref:C2H2-type domain-containing protein n=1 Tax=Cichlidogyrus casuarinus TaxID=1844966 RepID=A0ABD2QFS3_9PLAT
MVNVARLPHQTVTTTASVATNGTMVKDFPCSHCESTFSRKQYLNSHMAQFHRSNEHPYVCQLCTKGFARKWDFCRHINSVHRSNPMDAVSSRNLELVKNWMKDRGLYDKVVVPWMANRSKDSNPPPQSAPGFHEVSTTDLSTEQGSEMQTSVSMADGSQADFASSSTTSGPQLTLAGPTEVTTSSGAPYGELSSPTHVNSVLPEGLGVVTGYGTDEERPAIVSQQPMDSESQLYGEIIPTKMDESSASEEQEQEQNPVSLKLEEPPSNHNQSHVAALVPTT